MKKIVLALSVMASVVTASLPSEAKTCRTTCNTFGNQTVCRTSCY